MQVKILPKFLSRLTFGVIREKGELKQKNLRSNLARASSILRIEEKCASPPLLTIFSELKL